MPFARAWLQQEDSHVRDVRSKPIVVGRMDWSVLPKDLFWSPGFNCCSSETSWTGVARYYIHLPYYMFWFALPTLPILPNVSMFTHGTLYTPKLRLCQAQTLHAASSIEQLEHEEKFSWVSFLVNLNGDVMDVRRTCDFPRSSNSLSALNIEPWAAKKSDKHICSKCSHMARSVLVCFTSHVWMNWKLAREWLNRGV